MSVLVLVEGVSDRGFVEGIAKRVGVAVSVRELQGNRPDKVKRLIEALRAEKVFVLKDEHRYPDAAEHVERELKNRAVVVRVKCSLESWILIGLHAEGFETCDDPVKRMREVLARKGYAKVVLKSRALYKRLAEEVDIERLKERCSAFREFLKALTGR